MRVIANAETQKLFNNISFDPGKQLGLGLRIQNEQGVKGNQIMRPAQQAKRYISNTALKRV